MDITSLLQGGDARTFTINGTFLVVLYIVPMALMAFLVSSKKLSTPAKQVLSIPLLLAEILVPINFTAGNGVYDAGAAAVGYDGFLRFFELFWISPILYGKPAYADMDYLHRELWGCLRKFPKANDKKVYVKDKKFYHVLLNLAINIVLIDIIGSWINTYNSKDVLEISSRPPFVYFVFMIFTVIGMNCAFNTLGYALQLLYVIYYDGGSYCSELWRPLMVNPVMATSLDDLWSYRWHQMLRSSWVAFGYRPTRYVTQRILPKSIKNPVQISHVIGSLAVFVVSGGMHEYMIYCNVGWPIYRRFFMGQQMAFFFIHGFGMTIERVFREPLGQLLSKKCHPVLVRCLQHIWVISWVYYTFPYFMNGNGYWGMWHGNPFQFTNPYVTEVLRAFPTLRPFCGSLL
ncbi:hypothetical protein BX666DRAFT_1535016 [Dichotomocladium elegans]|nr:hypothetical protein BX666DRAFT_1535016 [Dichotomocladium elegans]